MAEYRDIQDLLFGYAAGDLPPALSMLVASHLTLSPESRSEVERLEAVGGAMLQDLDAGSSDEGVAASLAEVLDRLDEPEPITAATSPETEGDPSLPQPLRERLGMKLSEIPWRRIGPLGEFRLDTGETKETIRLLRIPAGRAMPVHTHTGTEATLVLRGGFSDASGHYGRGDLAVVDEAVNHQPVADPGEDCICLAVSTGHVQLTGSLGRMLNPFFKF